MTNTIGNPLSWGARHISAAGHGLAEAARHAGGAQEGYLPRVRPIDLGDLRAALKAGADDFMAFRTDVILACLLYPIVGFCLIWLSYHQGILPLVFPLVAGFALVGPAAAIGLYELSRRREAGESPGWGAMASVVHAPGFGAIVLLSAGLAALFVLWLLIAWTLHGLTMGPEPYPGAVAFAQEVLTTRGGWAMMLVGIPLGFCFALVVLAVSIVSFPLMLDRDVGLPVAVVTSVRLFRQNPGTVLAWGAIVAAGLVIGALPFLLGLAVTLPILGHATWHLYRRAVI